MSASMGEDIPWLETVLTEGENTPNKQQITQELSWLLVSVRRRLGGRVRGLDNSLHRGRRINQQGG